ncbi:MAG: hypothetical protein C0611_08495 [Desulfobacteraceae bacterium]|nr:MAG: hypothetical protein C0611_08495 [Desulfobacteraceae bacterium]
MAIIFLHYFIQSLFCLVKNNNTENAASNYTPKQTGKIEDSKLHSQNDADFSYQNKHRGQEKASLTKPANARELLVWKALENISVVRKTSFAAPPTNSVSLFRSKTVIFDIR